MRVFIMGAGHMGAWLVEEFCLDHEVAVYDIDRRKLKFFFLIMSPAPARMPPINVVIRGLNLS